MPNIYYKNNQLMIEDLSVNEITQQYGTPLYIYSKATIEKNWRAIDQAFGKQKHLVCYAVKASSNIAILHLLDKLGSGFDIVSLGELERVLAAGCSADKIVFSGVGKSEVEIRRSLEVGIKSFNVESKSELLKINQIAQDMQVQAPVSLRINPNIDAQTHSYISTGLKENKFGIEYQQGLEMILLAQKLSNIEIIGLGCHIGSQITEAGPFIDAAQAMADLINEMTKYDVKIQQLDLGGGLGVIYTDETVISAQEYVASQLKPLEQFKDLEIIVEPGRSIVANAGILVTKVNYLKYNTDINFAIVDAGMVDLIRPALYEAYMNITEVNINSELDKLLYDVVGPVCESADFLGKNRQLAIKEGDLIAVHTAGAYGASMSSNYNSRVFTPEVLIDRNDSYLIKERAEIKSLWQYEKIPEYK